MNSSKADIQKIIRHEEAHIQQWHSLDVILIEILSVALWCSPMIYFYKKSLRVVHEYLADAFVLETTQKKQYGHLLLKHTRSGLQLALANHFIHSQLKKRIVMMTRNHSTRSAMGKYLFMLPILAVLVMAFTNKVSTTKVEAFPLDVLKEQIELGDDTFPCFKGCETFEDVQARINCTKKKIIEYTLNNLKYPASARAKSIEGTVIVEFIIDTDGSIKDAIVTQGIGGGCDKEALRVVNAMPNWTAATKDGKAVALKQMLPFVFKLPKEANDSKATNEVYKVVEEMPRFPGCEDLEDSNARQKCSNKKLLEFIFQNLKYPKQAKENGTEGMVVVKFVVKSDGSIANAKAVRDIGDGCGAEAVRVVNTMPSWIPGKHKGELVDVEFNLPVRYKIDDPNVKEGASYILTPDNDGQNDYFVIEELAKYPNPYLKVYNRWGAMVYESKNYQNDWQGIANGEKVVSGFYFYVIKSENGKTLKGHLQISNGEELETIVYKNPNVSKDADAKIKTTLAKNVEHFKAYPNPSKGIINIEFQAKPGPTTLSVKDNVGKEVYRKEYKDYDGSFMKIEDLDLQLTVDGLLFIVLSQEGGEVPFSEAIFVKTE